MLSKGRLLVEIVWRFSMAVNWYFTQARAMWTVALSLAAERNVWIGHG